MTRRPIALLALLALASCGVDGPPRRPAGGEAPRVTMPGEAAALPMDAG
ncbi:MAG TPA: hypothetical protein PLL33_09685 [Paracoccus sp. (in: a-proteobacteria)]|nr:hypothetical protein [Paracoccus sp. (in: a-proteobacteria)]